MIFIFFFFQQPGHPMEIRQSGPEADECFSGGIYMQ